MKDDSADNATKYFQRCPADVQDIYRLALISQPLPDGPIRGNQRGSEVLADSAINFSQVCQADVQNIYSLISVLLSLYLVA